jgi:hypothetical protein
MVQLSEHPMADKATYEALEKQVTLLERKFDQLFQSIHLALCSVRG